MKDVKLRSVILLTLICISAGCWSRRPSTRTTRPPITNRPTYPPPVSACAGVNIVSRSQWQARAPKSITRFSSTPVTKFVHHSAGPRCTSQTACSAVVRGIQTYHMNTKGWDDIGYNFLVGEDGQAYEGRGWDRVGAQAKGFNSKSLGFCMLGDFMSVTPSSSARTAMQKLMQCGVDKGKLTSGSWIAGHRDCVRTDCPGNALYNMIQGWSGYRKKCP